MTLTYIPFNGDEAKALPFIAPDADYQHPYFDALDYTLYFASNVDGGKGGYDLYKSTLSFDGIWSTPQAVDIANTKDDEVFPTTSTDLDLYFSRSLPQLWTATLYARRWRYACAAGRIKQQRRRLRAALLKRQHAARFAK